MYLFNISRWRKYTSTCMVLRSYFLKKHFNGQIMTVFPQAPKRKIPDFRGKFYCCSAGDLIEWKCSLQYQLGCVAGEKKSSSLHSHSDGPHRQLIDGWRYCWNAEAQIRKDFLRNSILWKRHNLLYLDQNNNLWSFVIRMLFQSNKWVQIFNNRFVMFGTVRFMFSVNWFNPRKAFVTVPWKT